VTDARDLYLRRGEKGGQTTIEVAHLECDADALSSGGCSMSGNVAPSLSQHVRRLATTASSDERLLADFLSSPRKVMAPLLTTPSNKIAALVAWTVLAAVCVACAWNSHANQAHAANGAPPQVVAGAEDAVPDDPNRLPAQATVRLGTASYRHGTRIETMAVSADGKLAVTSSGNSPYNAALAGRFSPARLFDMTDGRCLYAFPNERGSYTEYPEAASLSPDGTTVATRDDKFLHLWDAATGKELRKVKYLPDASGRRSPTEWLTFTPDGKLIATAMMGTAVHLIDVETGAVKRTFDKGAPVRACVFSPDGKRMATGGYEEENGVYYARLWDVATGKEVCRFALGHELNQPVGALAFSHDGTKLAGGSSGDGRLRLFEVASGKELHVFSKIGAEIRAIAFAPDGKTVAAAGDGIYLYDPDTGQERLRIERQARALVFSRDGSVLIGAVSGAIYGGTRPAGGSSLRRRVKTVRWSRSWSAPTGGRCSLPTRTATSLSGTRPARNPPAASPRGSSAES
jgi:WD40 repeat protein